MKVKDDTQYNIGDVLIKSRKIYQVFKKSQKVIDNQNKEIIFYKSLYQKNNRGKIICSIPVENIAKTQIRRPFSKEKIDQFIELLKITPKLKNIIDIKKVAVYSKNIKLKALIMKRLWLEKKDLGNKFSYVKKKLLSELINSLKEEIAYVLTITPQEAEKNILSALEDS